MSRSNDPGQRTRHNDDDRYTPENRAVRGDGSIESFACLPDFTRAYAAVATIKPMRIEILSQAAL